MELFNYFPASQLLPVVVCSLRTLSIMCVCVCRSNIPDRTLARLKLTEKSFCLPRQATGCQRINKLYHFILSPTRKRSGYRYRLEEELFSQTTPKRNQQQVANWTTKWKRTEWNGSASALSGKVWKRMGCSWELESRETLLVHAQRRYWRKVSRNQ